MGLRVKAAPLLRRHKILSYTYHKMLIGARSRLQILYSISDKQSHFIKHAIDINLFYDDSKTRERSRTRFAGPRQTGAGGTYLQARPEIKNVLQNGHVLSIDHIVDSDIVYT